MAQLKNGEEVSLLKYSVHDDAKTYMIIESVTNTNSKTIHVINFSNRSRIKVGRGQNAEVRITDISVSRLHTFITCTKLGNVYIEDNMSKFGTLI
jgi:pSer/pThr/pTyr-binding forkhead associated (FHA) protein